MSNQTESVVGIIFPVRPEHAERFLGSPDRKVFVKFFGRGRPPERLKLGAKLFFYRSGGGQEIVGEARITAIKSATADEVWKQYGKALLLTQDELERYVGDRKTRQLLVLVTEDSKKYSTPLRLHKPVTMGGQYMTKSLYDRLTAVKDE